MDEFEVDKELHQTLAGIREGVRKLFEQLRLKTESGDISGKERLERVPALAKRNFGNLTGPNALRATKEAWRLIDFLEGGDEARLSPRARDALRVVELDAQLARLRASERWKDAAAGLREAVGAAGSSGDEAGRADRDIPVADISKTAGPEAASFADKLRQPAISRLAGWSAPIAIAALTASWWLGRSTDARYACLALESASASELAAHRAFEPGTPVALPPRRADARPRAYRIDDPPGGGPVRSIWTTSIFSYAERTTRRGPGGGRSDFRLRVGGWGDTYLALLKVPVPTNRLVQRAVVQLTVLGDEPSSRPTTMILRAISDNWQVNPGPNNRLWWRDCPQSAIIRPHLPPPGARDSVYEIDITDLYNSWALGQTAPYGIMLEPEQIGSWGEGRPHYSNYNTFYSTRAIDPADRPRLVLTY